MTKVYAYLARIKEQEKEVIAVSDGAGRALCVSSDKHWTLTREWDELHIIAPLVEAARWELAESERDFSGVDWKVMYEAMERERDDWRDKAYSASEGMRKATARAEDSEARTTPAVNVLDMSIRDLIAEVVGEARNAV